MKLYRKLIASVLRGTDEDDVREVRNLISYEVDCLKSCISILAFLLEVDIRGLLSVNDEIPMESDPVVKYYNFKPHLVVTEKLAKLNDGAKRLIITEILLLVIENLRLGLSPIANKLENISHKEFYARTISILIHLCKASLKLVVVDEGDTIPDLICRIICVLSVFATDEVKLFNSIRELPISLLQLVPKSIGIYILSALPRVAFTFNVLFPLDLRESYINSLSDQFCLLMEFFLLFTKENNTNQNDAENITVLQSVYSITLLQWLKFALDYIKYGSYICKGGGNLCNKLKTWLSQICNASSFKNVISLGGVRCFDYVVELVKLTDSNLFISYMIFRYPLSINESLRMIRTAGLHVISRDAFNSRSIFTFLLDGLDGDDITLFLENWLYLLSDSYKSLNDNSNTLVMDTCEILLDKVRNLALFNFDGPNNSSANRPKRHTKADEKLTQDTIFLARDIMIRLVNILDASKCKLKFTTTLDNCYNIIAGLGKKVIKWDSFSAEEIGNLEFCLFITWILREKRRDVKSRGFVDRVSSLKGSTDERIQFMLVLLNENVSTTPLSKRFKLYLIKKELNELLLNDDIKWCDLYRDYVDLGGVVDDLISENSEKMQEHLLQQLEAMPNDVNESSKYLNYASILLGISKGLNKEVPLKQSVILAILAKYDLIGKYNHIISDFLSCNLHEKLKHADGTIKEHLLLSLKDNLFNDQLYEFFAEIIISYMDELMGNPHWSLVEYNLFMIILDLFCDIVRIPNLFFIFLSNEERINLITKFLVTTNSIDRKCRKLSILRAKLNLILINHLLKTRDSILIPVEGDGEVDALSVNLKVLEEKGNTDSIKGSLKSPFITNNFISFFGTKFTLVSLSREEQDDDNFPSPLPSTIEFISKKVESIMVSNCGGFRIGMADKESILRGVLNLLDLIAYNSFKQLYNMDVENNELGLDNRISFECIKRLFSEFSQLPNTKLMLIAEYYFIYISTVTNMKYEEVKKKIITDNHLIRQDSLPFVFEFYRIAKSRLYK